MIRTDAQLAVARQRLAKAEAMLDDTKREVGHNPVQYPFFSAGLIDLIDSMRADIDAYLGVAPVPHTPDQVAVPETSRP